MAGIDAISTSRASPNREAETGPMCVQLCSAGHFYEQDEYEMTALEKDEAPLCRTKLDGQGEVAAPKDGAPISFFSSHVQTSSSE
jgi:hypothetical protein